MTALQYDDGLDADGYPLNEPYRKPFVHGSEVDAGDFKPISFGVALAAAVERLRRFHQIGGNCDSHIEYEIGAAILLFFERAGHPLQLCKTVDKNNIRDGLVLVPQFAWSYYRSDWAIYNPASRLAFLIECDGKDFHSSDKQRAHDAKKDAAALERGYLTMRFTGSQIHRDADGCAQKIYDAVYGS